MAYLRLKRLKIEKYRSVVPGTELVFNDGMNVLLGRNGTGKTTLLQLIAIVTRSAFGALVGEDFSIEYDVGFGEHGFRVTIANRPAEPSQRTALRNWRFAEGPRSEWAFRVDMLLSDGTKIPLLRGTPAGMTSDFMKATPDEPLRVRDPLRDTSPVEQAIDVLLNLYEIFETQTEERKEKVAAGALELSTFTLSVLKHQSRLRQHGGRFDEGLGTFNAIVSNEGFLSVEDAEPALLFLDTESRSVSGRFTPESVEVAASSRLSVSHPGFLSLPDNELPFLRRTLDLLGGTECQMTLSLEKEETTDQGGTTMYSNFEFLVTMDDGTVLRHDWLSYGQKRLLSFLYYAAANPDIIIADELVNGLHHEWIEACLDEIKDRQCFLTSQNPLLLDYLSFDSVESVQRAFILCDRKKNGKRAQLVWGNIPEDAATSFFRAYKAGVQHVSEILRTKGLW